MDYNKPLTEKEQQYVERSKTIKISDLSTPEILEIHECLKTAGLRVDWDVHQRLVEVFDALAKDRMQAK